MNRALKQYGAYIAIFFLVNLLYFTHAPAWAAAPGAPPHQTVPSPTPKSIDTSVSTATPVSAPVTETTVESGDRETNTSSTSETDSTQSSPQPSAPPEASDAPEASEAPEAPEAPEQLREDNIVLSEELVASPVASESPIFSGLVNVDILNMRGGPGIAFDVIGTLPFEYFVSVIGRNEEATWWFVCCLPTTDVEGWVSTQFITAGSDKVESIPLIPAEEIAALAESIAVKSSAVEPSIVETIVEGVEAGEIEALTQEASVKQEGQEIVADPALALSESTLAFDIEIEQSPKFVLQGQVVYLNFAVTNLADAKVFNVVLRDEFPSSLRFVRAEAVLRGRIETEQTDSGTTILTITWPRLPANSRTRATVALQIASDLPDGSVIDNLVLVDSENGEANIASISIGLPPTRFPDFK